MFQKKKTYHEFLDEGYGYHEGIDGKPRDLERALESYLKANPQENVLAQYLIGQVLLDLGIEQRNDSFLRSSEGWFNLAAWNGDESAMVMLGKSLHLSTTEKLRWLCIACASDDARVASMAHEELQVVLAGASPPQISEAGRLLYMYSGVYTAAEDKRKDIVQYLAYLPKVD